MPRATFLLAAAVLILASIAHAADADPLDKLGDENLAKIDFCFEKFCAAVAAKDAVLAAAFIGEMPRGMEKLDLKKEADKTRLLAHLQNFTGASLSASQRLPGGLGQVTFTTKDGKSLSQQMRNMGGRWKIVGL